jgi:hypothetical protein
LLLIEFRRNHIPVHTLPDFRVNCNELPKHMTMEFHYELL